MAWIDDRLSVGHPSRVMTAKVRREVGRLLALPSPRQRLTGLFTENTHRDYATCARVSFHFHVAVDSSRAFGRFPQSFISSCEETSPLSRKWMDAEVKHARARAHYIRTEVHFFYA